MFNTQLVEFTTPDRLLLPGLLFTPKTTQSAKKVAIFLHGNGSASVFYSVKRANQLAQEFSRQGIALLMFNNRGAHFIKTLKQQKTDLPGTQLESNYQDVTLGCAYELIKDCVHDINGAIEFLQTQGFNEIYLVGHSSGANKICVYDHYQPTNVVSKYVLLGGGDDTGLYFQMINDQKKFWLFLKKAQKKVQQGKGHQLIPKYMCRHIISYQSFLDIVDPNGDYNTFPFNEFLTGFKLSAQPLFNYFKKIVKPSLIVYGELDEYAPQQSGVVANQILQSQVKNQDNFEFQTIPQTDHSFHDQEHVLGQLVANWL